VKKEGKTLVVNMFRALMARMTLLVADESGMSTVEYSIVESYTIPLLVPFVCIPATTPLKDLSMRSKDAAASPWRPT
jgi:hypothetical protein